MDFFQPYHEPAVGFRQMRSNTLKSSQMKGGSGDDFEMGQQNLKEDSIKRNNFLNPTGEDSIKLGQNHQSFGNPKHG
jgi:hypothetical protein